MNQNANQAGKPGSQNEVRWAQGVEDFNSGRYWHAHEAWEQGWRLMPEGVARVWVQAMIQVAGVYVLLEKGRAGGARSLAEAAIEKIDGPGSGALERPVGLVAQDMPQVGLSQNLPRIEGSAEALREVVRGLRANESCSEVLAALLRRGLVARV